MIIWLPVQTVVLASGQYPAGIAGRARRVLAVTVGTGAGDGDWG
jgi:hypothetical protein